MAQRFVSSHDTSSNPEAVTSALFEDPEETSHWEQITPRHIPLEQGERYKGHVAEIFAAFGMDLDTPGTRSTPERFLKAV